MKKLLKCLPLFVVLGPCALHIGWNASRFPEKTALNEANRARADEIVAALWEFHRETGTFPENLAALEARYLADVGSLREPVRGFLYEARETGFSIEFLDAPLGTLPGDAYHRYVSEAGHWDSYFP